MVSLAYCKCDIFLSPLPKPIPFQRFSEMALLITKFRDSTTRSKRNRDRGSPCLRPRCSLNGAVGEPFFIINSEAVIMQAFIHPLHLSGKPICSRIHPRKPPEIQSKALWKSNLRIVALVFFLRHESISSLAIRVPSRICQPFRRATN